jgi:flagellar hook protein FlgE
MSINSAMLAGVTGLISNSSALAAISDNIANANTVGYKRVGIDFSSLVTNGAGVNGYSAGGVAAFSRQFVDQQGTLQASSNATDLAIAGNGFFVTTGHPENLTAGDSRYFTRAGAFTVDRNGYLMNTAGLYLQGWPADANGEITIDSANLTSLQSINILNIASSAQATSAASINANLNSDQTVNPADYAVGDMAKYAMDPSTGLKPDFSIQVPIADSKGGQRTIVIDFMKSATANEWYAEVRADPANSISTAAGDGMITSGTVTFDTTGKISGGTLSRSIALGGSGDADPAWAASLGLAAQTVSLDLANVTQFSSASTVNSVQPNGTAFGTLAGVNIDEDGYVTAVYENGTTRRMAQVAIATFPNPDGLTSTKGNAYRPSVNSGGYTLKAAGTAGAGKLSPSSLESSTVDLSTEFTGLITTQRAYSASSKIITTADQMMEELLNIKR